MTEQDNMQDILEKRKEYFDTLNEKNNIDHTRIDELDLDHIGIVLNYQQVDLMKIALSSNKIAYKEYQNKLISLNDVISEKGKRNRYISMLKSLTLDKEVPEKTKEVITKIYEQTKTNPNIAVETIVDVLDKLIFKLSTGVQDIIFRKMRKYGVVEKEGIKEMSMEEANKLLAYIEKDYTAINIKEEANFNNYVNSSGSYYKENLKSMLDFAYDLDKEIIIESLIPKTMPNYLKKLPKEMIKQRLILYVDEITKYFNIYNSTHKRMDRKPVIRGIGVFDDLNKSEYLEQFSLDELCEIALIARKNLPEVLFIYNESGLEISSNRTKAIANILKIIKFGKKHKNKLIDVVGYKMHVDLDNTKDEITETLRELAVGDLKVAITEFDVIPTEFMLLNNSRKEIEILRDRFISDFCNIITNFTLSKMVSIDSISIDSVCDNQSPILTTINNENLLKKKPIFRTLYSGMYDSNMNRKEEKFRIRGIKKKSQKGMADALCVGIIVLSIVIVISLVIFIFLKYTNK